MLFGLRLFFPYLDPLKRSQEGTSFTNSRGVYNRMGVRRDSDRTLDLEIRFAALDWHL